MTTVHTLASGSSGNALVCSCGDTHLLIDAGISCRRITAALRELGLTPADLDGIFITHTHTDHGRHFLRQFHLPAACVGDGAERGADLRRRACRLGAAGSQQQQREAKENDTQFLHEQ